MILECNSEVFEQILTLLQFGGYTLVRNSKDLFQSFGFDTQPVLIGLIIFQVPVHCQSHSLPGMVETPVRFIG